MPGAFIKFFMKKGEGEEGGGGRLFEGGVSLKNSISAKNFVFLSD